MSSRSECPLGPFLSNSFGDRYLYPINREAFNKVGSETIYQQRFGKIQLCENSLHVIVGLDSGLLLNYIRNWHPKKGARVVFLELPEILEKLQAEGLLEELEDHISCISRTEFFTQLKALKYREYFFLNQVSLWKSIAAEDAHLPEYLELYWETRDALERRDWEVKSTVCNQIFIQRQLENLADNRFSADCLQKLFPGKTAVLLAGGPSLDEILPWVKTHRSNLVVLAVSRVARRLQEVDLVPDMVFSLDPHSVSFDVSKEMLLWGKQTLFVNYYHVVPHLLANWQGQCVFLGPRFPWETTLNSHSTHTPGPTVTNVALAAAVTMGFSQIVLAGVDLCFSHTGHSHALGSNEALAGPQFGKQDTRVETNGGLQAYTMNSMAQAIPILGSQADAALKRGCQFINPASGAAKVPHVLHLPLGQIDFKQMRMSPWQTIQQALSKDSETDRRTHYQIMLDELIRVRTQFRQIIKLCTSAIKYNDGLFGRQGMSQNFKYKRKLDQIEKALNDDYKDFVPLIKTFGLKDFIKLSTPTDSETWSDEEIESMGRQYYQIYRNSVSRLIELIDGAIHRIEGRQQEEKEAVDFRFLFDFWTREKEEGRALLWRQRHANQVANWPVTAQNQLEQMSKDFLVMIADRNTDHLAKRKADADPKIARKSSILLFRKRDLAAIQGLLDGLTSMNQAATEPIQQLLAGYIAELKDEPDQALSYYHRIVAEPIGSVTEEALRRILSISLSHSDSENALLALDCLAGLSPVYIPQHADLLRIVGKPSQALDRYADYLEKIPDDPLVLMQVGKLYRELGMSVESLTVFRYLLEKDPQNRTYQQLIADLESEQQGAEKRT